MGTDGFEERRDEGHGEVRAVAYGEGGQSRRGGAEIEEGGITKTTGYVEGLEERRPGVVESVGFGVVGGGAGKAEGDEVFEGTDGVEEVTQRERFGD